MPEADLADFLSEEERSLLGEALGLATGSRHGVERGLRSGRGARQTTSISLKPYGIDEIKRLARRFGAKALHWTQC